MMTLICYCMFLICVGSIYPIVHMEVCPNIDDDEEVTIIIVSVVCVIIGWFTPIFTLTMQFFFPSSTIGSTLYSVERWQFESALWEHRVR